MADQKQEYSCGFVKLTGNPYDQVLLLRKKNPTWQAGLLNGVGGKVEEDETPLQSMQREWHEESLGSEEQQWTRFCTLELQFAVVHFFKATADIKTLAHLQGGQNDKGERYEVHSLERALTRRDIIPNLRWLLPLAFLDTVDQSADVVEQGCV